MQIAISARIAAASWGLPALGDSLAIWSEGGQAWLIAGANGGNGLAGWSLGSTASPGSGVWTAASLTATDGGLQPGAGLAVHLSGGAVQLFSFADPLAGMTMQQIGPGGTLGAPVIVLGDHAPVLGVTSFEILGGPQGDVAALTFRNLAGFSLYGLDASGGLSWLSDVADSAKSYLGDVSDTVSLHLGGVDYLITASALESGLTSFALDGPGRATLVDALGMRDGLPLAGAAALTLVQELGTTFVVAAATGSSALTVVRVNDLGCLFATDTILDDRSTRFAHPEALDSFRWAGRSFVVVAGSDAGLSVMEMRPDGKLLPTLTAAFETGAGLGAVTALKAAVHGTVLDVFAVEAGHTGVVAFQMDLSAMAGMIAATGASVHGTGKGELVWGAAGDQVLDGGGGEDWIFDGAGQDTLQGGSGADVFILVADGQTDRIADFDLHKDRIDLSDWGRLYSAAALTIAATADGATITWGGETLSLVSANGLPLTSASFTDADFLFL